VTKRIAVLLAGLLAAVSLSLVAAPAQAEEPPTCYSVPDLPGECLSQATFNYVVSLKQDRDSTAQALDYTRGQVTALQAGYATLTAHAQQASDALILMRAERDAASLRASQWMTKAIALRAKVITLRAKVRTLQALV
jgi:hypothetical protein